jgi:hypothetical protein
MAAHRFEVGDCVIHEEKRFPNTVRRTELIVVERLVGSGEPRYQLRSDGLPSCELSESELRPRSGQEDTVEVTALRVTGDPSPWAA